MPPLRDGLTGRWGAAGAAIAALVAAIAAIIAATAALLFAGGRFVFAPLLVMMDVPPHYARRRRWPLLVANVPVPVPPRPRAAGAAATACRGPWTLLLLLHRVAAEKWVMLQVLQRRGPMRAQLLQHRRSRLGRRPHCDSEPSGDGGDGVAGGGHVGVTGHNVVKRAPFIVPGLKNRAKIGELAQGQRMG